MEWQLLHDPGQTLQGAHQRLTGLRDAGQEVAYMKCTRQRCRVTENTRVMAACKPS
jgi:hypothetical protein